MPSQPWLARISSVIGSLGLALLLSTTASAGVLSPCTLQITHSDGGVSTRQVTAGQCANNSIPQGVTQIAVGNGTGQGRLTAFQSRNCTGSVVGQGPSPVFFSPPASVGSVRIDSCP
ncbi:hypothetical protein ACFP1Z_25085 [Streptomyces gamaensis]|uniref:Uncharacterized protein n=1 Tax=Streptomyces gamaensis TaxID=1763542 RepID=A0ABW0Z6L3_9ACTN